MRLEKEEKETAYIIAGYLRPKKGERLAESQKSICDWLSLRDIKVSPSKFRELVNFLRNEASEPILSTNKGYYYPKDASDLISFIKRLEGRIATQKKTLLKLKYIAIEWTTKTE